MTTGIRKATGLFYGSKRPAGPRHRTGPGFMLRSGLSSAARRSLLAAAAVPLLFAALAGCGETEEPAPAAQVQTAEPAATPQPAPAPESAPAEPQSAPQPAPAEPQPAPAPPAGGTSAEPVSVSFWDFNPTSTGADLAAQLTPAEVTCLEGRLGANYSAAMAAPLMGDAGEVLDGPSGSSPLVDCLTTGHIISVRISMLSASAGGFGDGTRSCVMDLLVSDPEVAGALTQAGDPAGAAVLKLFSCLTPEEAAFMAPPEEGPAPNPADIACLSGQLAGTPTGERILSVLSGDDPTGEGLTMAESAVLGEAVAACGIETEFGFPDAAASPPSVDMSDEMLPTDQAGGSGLCTFGLILNPGDFCYYEDFAILIQPDGSALLDGNIGGISMGNTLMDAPSINLNGFVATRIGTTWTIDSLP